MKVCLLTTLDKSMKSFMLPVAEYMKAQGDDVTLSCYMEQDFIDSLKADFKLVPLDIRRGFNIVKTLGNILCLRRMFKREKFDLIEYGTENAAFCASIAGKLAHINVRIYGHWGARYIGYRGLTRKISYLLEKIAAGCSTHVRQVSMKNMRMCVADKVYPAEKVKVLGRGGTVGVDMKKFDVSRKGEYRRQIREQYGIAPDDFVFGDVAYIRKDKGADELLAAFKELSETNAHLKLMMVGSYYEPDKPDETLYAWSIHSGKVIYPGQVNDVERYLSAMDCFVHPSYREGFGMVLQEAAAMEVPIITTNIFGPNEFITDEENGYLAESRNTDDLMRKMKAALADRDRLALFAREAYRLVCSDFDRRVMVRRIYEDRAAIIDEQSVMH